MSNDTRPDVRLRQAIAMQIVKARIPGYKHTRGELHDEADHVPDVYIDNILQLLAAATERSNRELLERLKAQSQTYTAYIGDGKFKAVDVEMIDAELKKLGGTDATK